MVRAVVAILILAVFSISGCVDTENDPGRDDAPVGFPSRTDDRAKPVLMVHGFRFSVGGDESASDPLIWNALKNHLVTQGWTGPLITYGYYGCDSDFDVHVSDHGSHDGGHHTDTTCGSQSHTLDTSIVHLAQHVAWAVYDHYAAHWECVDAVAHSMGGLILRYALHGVENGLPGFPDEICIEDLVTLGTPHQGAGFLGELCAGFRGFRQCEEMTDYEGFLSYLQESANPPMGSTTVDWTVVGSEGDWIVDLPSAIALDGAQKILFLDTLVGHTGKTGYQLMAADTSGYRVRVFDASNGGLVLQDAQAPLHWVADALFSARLDASGGVRPPIPEPIREAPEDAEVGLAPGQSITIKAGCVNERKDLKGGQWWTRSGQSAWVPNDFDSVQITASPWLKSWSHTFDSPGDYGVRFVCMSDTYETKGIEWQISVDSQYNDPPTATANDPSTSTTTSNTQVTFKGTCANPSSDLRLARWYLQVPGQGWELKDEDMVQWHDDPWTTAVSLTFTDEGTHNVRLQCEDEAGATHEVVWTLEYTSPPGPTAYRYNPSASSGTIDAGQSIEFQAGCSNPDDQLERGEWWTQVGNEAWQLEDTDYVQWSTDPWNKDRTYTFEQPGDYGVRFRCINDDGASDDVTWSVTAI